MAINLTKNNASGRLGRRRKVVMNSEINVTPLVDVMLVLLIIFMVTSPMLVSGINVDLPETKYNPITSSEEPVVISIDAKSNIYIAESRVEHAKLIDKLNITLKEKKDNRIFVRGDKNIAYGEVVKIMSEIYAAGYTKVALISNIKHDK